jgi:hypothetical protein
VISAVGSDERLARAVLPIARLLADKHHARARRSGPENRLGGVPEQIATLACLRRRDEIRKLPARRQVVGCRFTGGEYPVVAPGFTCRARRVLRRAVGGVR